ncbi:MAG: hypothetical protein LC104_08665 [Bacteroidales bacterium]|nr:hypothetical protein [Bacteroidales bacterium]
MCIRIAQILLTLLLLYLAIVIGAFVYLVWWQALCVSIGTIFVFFLALRLVVMIYLPRYFRYRAGGIQDLMEQHSAVLRDAAVEVHSLQKISPPAPRQPEHPPLPLSQPDSPIDAADTARLEANSESRKTQISDMNWYQMDVTIFPQNPDLQIPWNMDQLAFVPADTPEPELFPLGIPGAYLRTGHEFEIEPHHILLRVSDDAIEPEESELYGVQRLLIIAGFPKTYREVKFRYLLAQFGHISLPQKRSRSR